MSICGWIFGIVCLTIAVIVVYDSHRKTHKTLDTLDFMIEQAMNGTYAETTFDESMLSALETRFAHYLSASTTSSQNVIEEKELIKKLIGNISHQTKTPIANLLLYTELLQEENLSPEAKVCVDTLYDQAKKLHFLIDSLVKLSLLENGIISLKPEKNAIAPILQQVQKQFVQKATAKDITLTISTTEYTACFDPKWTAEALCNLVDNAIKYTENGSVTISVISYELFTRIDVIDTGVGIPESQLAQIFTRFYRGNSHAQQEGIGIGLYLTREIIRSEGGYIKVSSEVGKGSVFSIFLPV